MPPLRRWQPAPRKSPPPNFENDKVNPASEGSRVIAVSFAPQTKTYLADDGLTPKFADKDSILISNGEDLDTCKVKIDDKTGEATISTDLTGPLTAAYPAKFAKIKDGEFDGFEIPAMQSGKFSDANLCYAEMEGKDESSLNFMNCCPVLKFYVDTSIGVKSIKITSSTEHIAGNSMTITVKAPEGKTLYDVMPSEGQDRRICYVALDGKDVHSTELKFETETTTQGPVTRTPKKNILLKEGYMYNAFIPYYIEVNGQKWAYCNIGAFLPEEPGDYFMWAEVKGHKADFSKESFDDGEGMVSIVDAFTDDFKNFDYGDERYYKTWTASECFAFNNAPYRAAEDYRKYTGSDYNTLQPEDDAASVNWGGNWRMPTEGEYQVLLLAEKTWGNYKSSGKLGVSFKGEGNNQVFFPAVGASNKSDLSVILWNNNFGYYWSSTLRDSDKTKALSLIFFCEAEESNILDYPRSIGQSIRPIVDEPQEEIQSGDDNEDYNHQSTSTWFDEE